uniref:Aldehyde dehydrogenase n=1 Tax=Heterorhabditis bacteriophora TaxID=37862 RepID=A0A1I7WGS0_HETBA
MAIVEQQLFIGRVWQQEGQGNGELLVARNGTDPALLSPLRNTFTARPYHDFSQRIEER